MEIKTSNLDLAPRPENEKRRVMAVVKTGLIDNPDPELFQIYCDLAQDITGFKSATFSLHDSENQCGIANNGKEEFFSGKKSFRDINNICDYVLLDHNPLLIPDFRKHHKWKDHPKVVSGESWLGYAGFPVINKDNYALGTLCMQNPDPMSLSSEKVEMVKKITKNIAHLLDLKTEQKELTSQKILDVLDGFFEVNKDFNLNDFKTFLGVCSDMSVLEIHAKKIIDCGICEMNANGNICLTAEGRALQNKMKLQTKVMKKIKLDGDDASNLVDQMLSKINI